MIPINLWPSVISSEQLVFILSRRDSFLVKVNKYGSYYLTKDEDVNNDLFSYLLVSLWPVNDYCIFVKSSVSIRVIT